MTFDTNEDSEGLSRYKIHARREIVNLLRNLGSHKQLIRMQATHGADSALTSILIVDEAAGIVIIDCTPSQLTNERLVESGEIAFETVLDNIRLLFSAPKIEFCIHEDRPALSIPIPASVIRMQRREFYRVVTPVMTPVKCTIQIPDATGKYVTTTVLQVSNISGGGIGVVDDKNRIPPDFSVDYPNCRLELPGSPVTLTLRLKNAQNVTLNNGKKVRRLGFMFVNPPNSVETAIQRYITKLERERNAKNAGIG